MLKSTTSAQYDKLKTIETHTRMRQVFYSSCYDLPRNPSFGVDKRKKKSILMRFWIVSFSFIYRFCMILRSPFYFLNWKKVQLEKKLKKIIWKKTQLQKGSNEPCYINENQRELSLFWINSPRMVSDEWIHIK